MQQKGVEHYTSNSPTVSVEAFLMTCAIDVKEGRIVVTCDIPGAYLQATIDELCYVLIEGALVDCCRG